MSEENVKRNKQRHWEAKAEPFNPKIGSRLRPFVLSSVLALLIAEQKAALLIDELITR